VLLHPSVLLELALERQRELAADAERRRLIKRALARQASRPGESESPSPDASESDGAAVVADVERRAA
jgi:hypothetical protein